MIKGKGEMHMETSSFTDFGNAVERLEKILAGEITVEREIKEQLVLDLVRKHELLIADGADALGMNWGDFIHLMAQNGIPYFDISLEEWEEDRKTLDAVLKKLRKQKQQDSSK